MYCDVFARTSRRLRPALAGVALLAWAGCGSSPDAGRPDAGDGRTIDGAPDVHVPVQSRRLGMNDVSILVPLPEQTRNPTLAAITGITPGVELVPRDAFQRIVTTPGDVLEGYERFHVVAVRFDLCDRPDPGPCPPGLDGRVRLVLQPLDPQHGTARDVALHAFYPIPAAELGVVVDELRALAEIQNAPLKAPLGISPALAAGPERARYAGRLRELVARYAAGTKLTRLTLFAQHAISAALNWRFRGVERQGSGFKDMVIPDVRAAEQRTILEGFSSYATEPVADSPPGFVMALDEQMFSAGTPATRRQALGALTEVLDPTRRAPETVQCVACHVSTLLTARRSVAASANPATLPGRYTSSYNLSISNGIATTNERSLRAFGWVIREPAISQRVINETAQVLSEIEARFPPAAP